MRTTLTLDDDVAALLQRLLKERRVSLKSLVNEALRAGIEELIDPSPKRGTPYSLETVSLGARVTNLDDVAEVLSVYEGDLWR